MSDNHEDRRRDFGERRESPRRGGKGIGRHKGGYADADLSDVMTIWIGGLPRDVKEREVERMVSKFGPVAEVTVRHSPQDTFSFAHFSKKNCAGDAVKRLDQSNPFGSGIIKVAPASTRRFTGKGSKGGGRSDGGNGKWQRKASPSPRRSRSRSPQRKRSRSRSGRRDPSRDKQRRDPSREKERRDPSRDKERRDRRRSPSPNQSRNIRVCLSQLPRDMDEDELEEVAREYGKVLKLDLHRDGEYKSGWVEYAANKDAKHAVKDLDGRRMADWSMRLQAYIKK